MRIRELTLAAYQPEEMRKFYSGFGFAEIEALGGSDGYAFHAGYTRFSFVPGDRDVRYHFAFNVKPDQLEDAVSWAQRSGATLLENEERKGHYVDFPDWKARSVYFFDPAGNIVEIIGRAGLPRAGNAPKFSAGSLLGVSEIGLVCDEVPAMRDWITGTHGIGLFARHQHTDQFTALGNDEGLLLLVPKGRNWFMGNFPATHYPLALQLEEDGRNVRLMLP